MLVNWVTRDKAPKYLTEENVITLQLKTNPVIKLLLEKQFPAVKKEPSTEKGK